MSSPAAMLAAGSPRAAAIRRLGALAAPHVLLIGAAIALWLSSLQGADLARISGYGLLPALPASYYLALLALAAGFLAALARRSTPPPLLALYVLALIFALHGTTPLLYSEPRYAWTYKHIGVAEYIAHYGATDRSIDIYQNWPAFFALLAALHAAAGASLLALAPWAEVFFECGYVVAIAFLLRGLTDRWRVILTATWLFVLANWLGQDYLAPQSFAYLLSLALIGVCVRCAGPPRTGPGASRLATRWWKRLQRIQGDRGSPFVDRPPEDPLRPPVALAVAGLLFVAIVTSHQLSPVLCILALGAFALTTRRLGAWPLVAMVGFEVAWVALALPLLTSKYQLLDLSPLERPVTTGGNTTWALPGLGASVIAARLSVAIVVLLAAGGLWRRRRAGRFDLPLVAVALAPALALAVQPYSGEGIFRVYLFALPWLCFLAADLLLGVLDHRRGAGARSLALLAPAAASVLLGAGFLFASYGREIVNYVTPQDVAIESVYERDAPPGSAVVYLAPNVPNRLTWRYAQKQVWAGSFSPSLTEDPEFVGHALGASSLAGIAAKMRGLRATRAYLMIAPSQTRYVEAYGLLPPGSVESLIVALDASSNFELVARDGEARLYRLLEPSERAR